jgi:hypothetical protein
MKGIEKIQLNIEVREVHRKSSISMLSTMGAKLISQGDMALKSGFNQTFETIGKVQNTVIGTAKTGMQMLTSNDISADPNYIKLQTELQESQIVVERLKESLAVEKKERQAADTELMKMTISKDRIIRQMGNEISRLEGLLKANGIPFESILSSIS